jgi:hypothetical protein
VVNPLSFLDERDEAPSRPRGARRSPPRGPGTDNQTLRTRRLIAAGLGLLLLVLFVFLIKSCRDNAREQAFKDYARDVGALLQESDQESKSLFDVLSKPGTQSPVQLASSVNGFRSEAAQLVDRARETDHPDQLNKAQRHLIETLEFRRDGIGAIARDLPAALGDQRRSEAVARIARQMQSFLASDVIYSQRVVPAMQSAYRDEKLLEAVNIPQSQFLPDASWLNAGTVGDRISGLRGGADDRTATPGLHGTSLDAVTVKPGGTSLQAGGAAEIRSSPNISFDVQITNGGESEERDVNVRLSITGAGKPIQVEERLDTIAPGTQKTVSIPLAAAPPTGRPVTIQVQVQAVPGEKKVDNNKASYPAVFSGG